MKLPVALCTTGFVPLLRETFLIHIFAIFCSNFHRSESVYPFSFLLIHPLKCRYEYSVHQEDLENLDTQLEAMHGWLGSMTVCCTPMVRLGKWQVDFHRPGTGDPEINIDQSKNLLEVERGNDLLGALCIAYAFDKALCQPLVTIVGYSEKEHPDDDEDSLDDYDDAPPRRRQYPMLGAPPEEEEEVEYEEDEEFEPDGYLGYEDPEAPKEEAAGYLHAEPYEEEEEEHVFEPDGYLEGEAPEHEQRAPDGYLEGEEYDDEEYDEESHDVAGYIEGDEADARGSHAGYLENDHGHAGYLENDEFHDEP